MDRAADEDIAAAFAKGAPDALALAYQRYSPLVYTAAVRALGRHGDAEDVTQQVFVAAWRSQDSFDPGRGGLAGWLLAITRNKIVDHIRARQRESGALANLAGTARAAGLPGLPDDTVNRIVLADELARLGEPQHMIMRLAFSTPI